MNKALIAMVTAVLSLAFVAFIASFASAERKARALVEQHQQHLIDLQADAKKHSHYIELAPREPLIGNDSSVELTIVSNVQTGKVFVIGTSLNDNQFTITQLQ